MANTTGACHSWVQELGGGVHNMNVGGDILMIALYLATASIGPTTTAYTTSGELQAAGTYTAGGQQLTNRNWGRTSNVSFWCPDTPNPTWTGIGNGTNTFNGALIYNSSKSNKAIAAFNFGDFTLNNGNFFLNIPSYDATNALIKLTA